MSRLPYTPAEDNFFFFSSLILCVPSAIHKAWTCIHYYSHGFSEICGLFPTSFSLLHLRSFGTDICSLLPWKFNIFHWRTLYYGYVFVLRIDGSLQSKNTVDTVAICTLLFEFCVCVYIYIVTFLLKIWCAIKKRGVMFVWCCVLTVER